MATTAARPQARDLRIDFLRGLFILSLGGSHFAWFSHEVGYHYWLRFYDIQPFGFSSPAEFFVFFSGYVMSLVLARRYEATGFLLTGARVLDRSWSLYVLNTFTFAIAVGLASILFVHSPILRDLTGMDRFAADPVNFIADFLTFRDHLTFFEILRNYIFFLPFVAPFLWLARKNVYLPIAISLCIWLANQLYFARHIAYHTFNPLGWQLIFFLGATVALVKPMTEWRFPHRGRQIAICVVLILIALALREIFLPNVASERLPFATKRDIGPIRLVHFALLLWTAMLLVPASETLERSRLVRGVIKVGQNSLECFCMSSLLAYSGAAIVSFAPESVPLYWLVVFSIMSLLLLGAQTVHWLKAEPWNAKRAR